MCFVFPLTDVLILFLETVRREGFSVPYPWTRPLFCSCWSRMFSSFRGLGMKPISQPSFTNRPIHQSLLNFWGTRGKKKEEGRSKFMSCRFTKSYVWAINRDMHLFYVEEILGVKGDGCSWYWNILIQCATIADVGPHSKCHRFSLEDGSKHEAISYQPVLSPYPSTTNSNARLCASRLWIWLKSRHSLATLALSSWMVACCSRSWRLCPGPWFWLGLWLWTWAWTSRSSSRETSESDGLLVYESAEPCNHRSHGVLRKLQDTETGQVVITWEHAGTKIA